MTGIDSIGFAGGEVVRKTGLLAALLLGMALAFSLTIGPTRAYSEVTGSTIYEVDPNPDGDGGGHSFDGEGATSFFDNLRAGFEDVVYNISDWWQSALSPYTGGGSSSSSSSGSSSSGGTTTQDGFTDFLTLNYIGNVDSSSNYHRSAMDYSINSSNEFYSNNGTGYFAHHWANVSQYPRVLTCKLKVLSQYVEGYRQWLSSGYNIFCCYSMGANYGSTAGSLSLYMVQSGGLTYDDSSKQYKILAGYKYIGMQDNRNRSSFYDGTNIFTWDNQSPYRSPSTSSNDKILVNGVNSTQYTGYYVAVLYADGSTGTGGAPSGSGGGSGGSGDTYNTTNNYNTTTTYNNLDLDLSPITQRQDNALRTINQIGKDVNKILYQLGDDLDKDLQRVFTAVMLNYMQLTKNGTILQKIQDELTDGYLKDIEADIDLIAKELTNLQSNASLQSVKGFLYTINDNIKDILQELESLPSGGSGGSGGGSGGSVDVDLTAVTDELEDFHLDAISAWDEMVSRLDTIIDDIEHMRRWQPTTPKPEPPSDLEKALGVDALKDALARLMGKFPFSTINNLVLILTALVRPAVAPVFDLPMPNPSDWSSPYMVHVDLSDWSQVAAMMRVGILLWAIGRVSRRTVNLWTREEGGGE